MRSNPLLCGPRIRMGGERTTEIIQSLTCLAEQLIGLSALRERDGILGLGSQCFAKIIDRLLIVAQRQVKVAAIEAAIGLSGVAL